MHVVPAKSILHASGMFSERFSSAYTVSDMILHVVSMYPAEFLCFPT